MQGSEVRWGWDGGGGERKRREEEGRGDVGIGRRRGMKELRERGEWEREG